MSDDFKVDPNDKKLLGHELGMILAKALGIDYPIRSIRLDADVNNVGIVTVESIVRNEQGKRVAAILTEEFELVKKSEKQTPSVSE